MAWRRLKLSADSPGLTGPLLYGGGYLRSGAGGASTVEIFDGAAASFDRVDSFATAAANGIDRHEIVNGLFLMRGLFVDLGANIDTFEVWYDVDIPDALGGPRSGP